jgi:hypothetical protein
MFVTHSTHLGHRDVDGDDRFTLIELAATGSPHQGSSGQVLCLAEASHDVSAVKRQTCDNNRQHTLKQHTNTLHFRLQEWLLPV